MRDKTSPLTPADEHLPLDILLVDDHEGSLHLLADTLRQWGHRVLCSRSALEALDVLSREAAVNVLLTDWVMPDVDGLELCRLARRLERDRYLHAVVLTGTRAGPGNQVAALDAGADAFVPKTLDLAELYLQLRVAQRVVRLEDQLSRQIAQLSEAREELREKNREIQRRNRELEEARRAADAASEAKSRFLANVSHEIRTPLNGILGLLRVLEGGDPGLPLEDALSLMRLSAENLLAIIEDVLDFSKIEAGRVDLEHGPFSLMEVLHAATAPLGPQAVQKGLALASAARHDVPDRLLGDGHRLRQVLTNLLSNAVKFTSHGHALLWVESLGEREGEVDLRFTVEDTGIGIPPEQRELIFQAFAQADTSITRRFGGTGLGLSITAHLVRLMGGAVHLDSEPGRGSTFWFDLRLRLDAQEGVEPCRGLLEGETFQVDLEEPAERRVAEEVLARCGAAPGEPGFRIRQEGGRIMLGPAGAEQAVRRPLTPISLLEALTRQGADTTQDSRPRPWQGMRVLLAEDNRVNQVVMRRLLERHGVCVEVVGTGREAVASTRVRPFDLVVMDIEMPDMDGLEATVRIRAHERETGRPATPVVALTAWAREEDRKRCEAVGMNDYLSKPLRPGSLERVLERAAAARAGRGR